MSKSIRKKITLILSIILIIALIAGVCYFCNISNAEISFNNSNNLKNVEKLAFNVPNGYFGVSDHIQQTEDPTIKWISNQTELEEFFKDDTKLHGILTKSFDINWNGGTSTYHFKKDKTLDGNGYTITINGDQNGKIRFTNELYTNKSYENVTSRILPEIEMLTCGVGLSYDENGAEVKNKKVTVCTRIAGGLVTVNEGNIINTNIIWNATNYEYDSSLDSNYRSTAIGMMVGLNLGKIENCSLTVAKDFTYNMLYSYDGGETYRKGKALETMRNSVGTIGGFVGANIDTGKIYKCKIDMQHRFKAYSPKANKHAYVRLFLGGIAGVNEVGAEICDVYATGNGNIQTQGVANSENNESMFTSCGIICGSIAKDDKGDPDLWEDSEGYGASSTTGCYATPGIIRGVVSDWTGWATMNYGSEFINGTRLHQSLKIYRDPETGTHKGDSTNTFKSRGLICGMAGLSDYQGTSQRTLDLKNVYFINYPSENGQEYIMPDITVGRYFGEINNNYRGNLIVVDEPKDNNSTVTFTFDINHKLDIKFKVNTDIPENENKLIWSIDAGRKLKTETQFENNNLLYYNTIDTMKDISQCQEWSSSMIALSTESIEKGIPDEVYDVETKKYPHSAYKFSANYGQAVTFKPVSHDNDQLIEDNDVQVNSMILKKYKSREFDGKISLIPRLELYKDLGKTKIIIDQYIEDASIYDYYDASESQNGQDKNNYAGKWTLSFNSQDNTQLFVCKKGEKGNLDNYVSYTKDSNVNNASDYRFYREITKKELTYTLIKPIEGASAVFRNADFEIRTELPSNDTLGGLVTGYETVKPKFIYTLGDKIKSNLKDVGDYVITIDNCFVENLSEDHYKNYTINQKIKSITFKITPKSVQFIDPINTSKTSEALVYDGESVKIKTIEENAKNLDPDVFYIKHTDILGLSSESVFFSNIIAEKPADIIDGFRTDNEKINVGWFKVFIKLNDPNFQIESSEGNKKLESVEYFMQIRPKTIELQANVLSMEYTGGQAKIIDIPIPTTPEEIKNSKANVFIKNKPVKGVDVNLVKELTPVGNEIERKGIDIGTYKLKISLSSDSRNYTLGNKDGEEIPYVILDEEYKITPANIEVKADTSVLTDLTKKYSTTVYTGERTALHIEKVNGTVEGLKDNDYRNMEFTKKYFKKNPNYKPEGKEPEYIEYVDDQGKRIIPRDIGDYYVKLTIQNYIGSSLKNYTVNDADMFAFKIVPLDVQISLKDVDIQYGDTIQDIEMDCLIKNGDNKDKVLSRKNTFRDDDIRFSYTIKDQTNTTVYGFSKPGLYSIQYKGKDGLDAKNYNITLGTQKANVNVKLRDVCIHFGYEELLENEGYVTEVIYDGTTKNASAYIEYVGKETWIGSSCSIIMEKYVEGDVNPVADANIPIINVGEYKYIVKLAPESKEFFNLVSNSIDKAPVDSVVGTFNVSPIDVDFKINVANKQISYGGNCKPTSTQSGEFIARDGIQIKYVYIKDGVQYDVPYIPGEYTVQVAITGNSQENINNYIVSNSIVDTVTVSQRDLKIDIKKQDLSYGDDVSKLSSTNEYYAVSLATPFIDGDDANLKLKSVKYNKDMIVGDTFDITLDTDSILHKEGYNFIINEGVGTVQKKNINVKVIFDQNAKYTGKAQSVTLVYDDTKDTPFDLANKITYNQLDSAINAGEYLVEVELTDAAISANYSVKLINNKITIAPMDVSYDVILEGKKEYGSSIVVYDKPNEAVQASNPEQAILADDLINQIETFIFYVEYPLPEGTTEKLGETLNGLVQVDVKYKENAPHNYNIITKGKGATKIVANTFNVSIDPASNNKVYDGNQHMPNIIGANKDELDFYIFDNNANEYRAVLPTDFINAGKYQIKIEVNAAASEKYGTIKSAEFKDTLFVINPRPITLSMQENNLRVLFGDELNVKGTYDAEEFKNQLVTELDKNQIQIATETNYTAGSTGIDGTTIIYKLTGNGNENYYIQNDSANVVVEARNVTISSITLPENLVYDGTVKDNVKVDFDYTTFTPELNIVFLQNDVEVDPINVGIYTIKVTLNTNNFILSSAAANTKEMEITKLDITATLKAKDNLVYNGESIQGVDVTFDIANVVTNSQYNIVYKKGEYSGNLVDAGKYTAMFEFKPEYADNYNLTTTEVEVNVAKLKITATLEGIQNLIYNGEEQNIVNVTITPEVKPEQYSVVYKINNKETTPLNAGLYNVSLVLVDTNNLEFAEAPAAIEVNIAKIKGVVDLSGISIKGNYNKIVVTGPKGYEYSINNGANWNNKGTFDKISTKHTYTVKVRTIEDINHESSDVAVVGKYTTGADPTLVNNALNQINEVFNYTDIEKIDKAISLLKDVHKEDMQFVNIAKLNKAKADKETLINDLNTLVEEAQIAAGKAGGKKTDSTGAAAAAVSLSLAGVALALAKKKMFL